MLAASDPAPQAILSKTETLAFEVPSLTPGCVHGIRTVDMGRVDLSVKTFQQRIRHNESHRLPSSMPCADHECVI